jgi:glutamate--cysteine ligase
MRPYDLLKNFGIEYLEIRGVDIAPSDITGMSKHHVRFLDLILMYCLILPSPKITPKEKKEIDSNEHVAIYRGRDEEAKILINGNQVKINEARDEMLGNLRSIAKCMNESQLFNDSIDHMLSLKKGELSKSSFHNYGIEKAKSNLELLKSADDKNIDSIKKEAELSLEELAKMSTNSRQEMNEFVKNYNLDL